MRIGDDGGEKLRAARGRDPAVPLHRPVPQGALPARSVEFLFPRGEGQLQLLVQHPLQRALAHAEVARAQAPVQATDAFGLDRLPHAVERVLVLPRPAPAADFLGMVLVQLQARLDEPDGIRRRAGDHACHGGSAEMDPRTFCAPVELFGDHPLPVPVGVEVYGARGDDAGEVGAEAFEEGPPAFDAVDGEKDLEGFLEME